VDLWNNYGTGWRKDLLKSLCLLWTITPLAAYAEWLYFPDGRDMTVIATPVSANLCPFAFPRGPAYETLTWFGSQTGLDTFFDAATVNDQPTQAIYGWYKPKVALAHMLIGSGLTFSVTRLGVMSIVRKTDRSEVPELLAPLTPRKVALLPQPPGAARPSAPEKETKARILTRSTEELPANCTCAARLPTQLVQALHLDVADWLHECFEGGDFSRRHFAPSCGW
jgi:hypothetical protein